MLRGARIVAPKSMLHGYDQLVQEQLDNLKGDQPDRVEEEEEEEQEQEEEEDSEEHPGGRLRRRVPQRRTRPPSKWREAIGSRRSMDRRRT